MGSSAPADSETEAYSHLAVAIAKNAYERAIYDSEWLSAKFPPEIPRPIFFHSFETTGEQIRLDLSLWKVFRDVEMSCNVFTCNPAEAGQLARLNRAMGRSLDAVLRTFILAYENHNDYIGDESNPTRTFTPPNELQQLYDALTRTGHVVRFGSAVQWTPRVVLLIEAGCFPDPPWPGQSPDGPQ
jgi:hypothetical protein